MKIALRPQNMILVALLAALCLPGITGAVTLPTTRATAALTDFDEGKADGNAYRISVERAPNGSELIAQQVGAAQSAVAANPSTAPYFRGYIIGLQPERELTTLIQPQP